jgi:hypothetical protein
MDDSILYPEGLSEELAARLYGEVTVPWSSKPFAFDLARSECRFWLDYGLGTISPGGRYDEEGASWPPLANVIRRERFEGDKARVFQWSNGMVFEQEPPDESRDDTPGT